MTHIPRSPLARRVAHAVKKKIKQARNSKYYTKYIVKTLFVLLLNTQKKKMI